MIYAPVEVNDEVVLRPPWKDERGVRLEVVSSWEDGVSVLLSWEDAQRLYEGLVEALSHRA